MSDVALPFFISVIIIIIISCYLSFKLKQLNECIQLDLLKNMEKKMQDIRPLWVDKAEYGWIIFLRFSKIKSKRNTYLELLVL